MENELIKAPQMILIGSFGRNDGKTTLACDIIRRFSGIMPVYGLKVITVEKADGKCQRGHAHCSVCTSFSGEYSLMEETGANPAKDTAKMLAAGAEKSYLLATLKSAASRAVSGFLDTIPTGALVVCESNAIRNVVEPGVFLYAAYRFLQDAESSINTIKPSAREFVHLADRLAVSGDGTVENGLITEKQPNGTIKVSLNENYKQKQENLNLFKTSE